MASVLERDTTSADTPLEVFPERPVAEEQIEQAIATRQEGTGIRLGSIVQSILTKIPMNRPTPVQTPEMLENAFEDTRRRIAGEQGYNASRNAPHVAAYRSFENQGQ